MANHSPKLKVLWIPAWFPHDKDPQLGNFFLQQAQALAERTDLTVLTFNRKFRNSHQYSFHWIDFSGSGLKRVQALRKWSIYLDRFLAEFDIVHIHGYSPVFTFLRRKLKKQEKSFFYSDQWSGFLRNEDSGIAARRFFFEKAEMAFVPSQEMAEKIESLGLPRPGILYNIIEVGSAQKINTTQLEPYAIMIADMVDKVKGIGAVIEAWNRLDPELNLVLVGDGADRDSLELRAGENPTIHFLGRKDQPTSMAYLDKAEFLIQNSSVETFGMVVLEALALGKPVLFRNVGIIKELDLSEAGIELEYGDPGEIEEALRWMIQRKDNFDTESLRQISSPFSAEANSKTLLKFYAENVKQGKSAV